MKNVIQNIQHSGDMDFFPTISPYTDDNLIVNQISHTLFVQPEKLPNFFVVHPKSLNVVPFDRPLNQSNNYQPETILEWARNTVSKLELIGREDSKIMEVVNKMQ